MINLPVNDGKCFTSYLFNLLNERAVEAPFFHGTKDTSSLSECLPLQQWLLMTIASAGNIVVLSGSFISQCSVVEWTPHHADLYWFEPSGCMWLHVLQLLFYS